MSQAEELLNSLGTDEVALYSAGSGTDEPHIIIGEDRFITVPEQLKRIAVQDDKDIETVTFDCPRYWDGHDLSLMSIRVNYMRADGQKDFYEAKNVRVNSSDTNLIHFDWTISEFAAKVKGTLIFIICVKQLDADGLEKRKWHSELCKDLYISEGLECEAAIFDQHPTVLQELLLRMDDLEVRVDDVEGTFPIVTEADNGKIPMVVDGVWTLVKIVVAEEVSV